MSYSFYVALDTGCEPYLVEPCFADTHPAFHGDGMAGNVIVTQNGYARCGNYTSNVSPIWARALTAALADHPEAREWVGNDDRYCRTTFANQADRLIATDHLCLRDLQGLRCGDIAPLLASAVRWGVEHIADLRELAPTNGWGDAEGAITYLWDIQRMCEQMPTGKLEISS